MSFKSLILIFPPRWKFSFMINIYSVTHIEFYVGLFHGYWGIHSCFLPILTLSLTPTSVSQLSHLSWIRRPHLMTRVRMWSMFALVTFHKARKASPDAIKTQIVIIFFWLVIRIRRIYAPSIYFSITGPRTHYPTKNDTMLYDKLALYIQWKGAFYKLVLSTINLCFVLFCGR